MASTKDTPRVKRARYVIGTGDRVQADNLRESYENELHTPGLTTRHKRDLETALTELDNHIWGDTPLAAKPKEAANGAGPGEQAHGLRSRAAKATQIHASRRRGDRAGRYAARRAQRRFQQTGIPAGYESTAQLVMQTIGGLVGLSFVFLLLSPNGSRALQTFANGLSYSLRALISPGVDPLRSSASAQRASHMPVGQATGVQPAINSAVSTVANTIDQVANRVGALPAPARPAPQSINTQASRQP